MLGHGPADTARATGDDDGAAREVEGQVAHQAPAPARLAATPPVQGAAEAR